MINFLKSKLEILQSIRKKKNDMKKSMLAINTYNSEYKLQDGL